MKKLPIGIQTFSEIVNGNYYYIDKTDLAYRLVDRGKYYFLSRPQRFGKSLFCDTLTEMFKGNKKLFEGLAAYDLWNWEEQFPVIKISFGSGGFKNIDDLHREVRRIFEYNNDELGLSSELEDAEDVRGILFSIINTCYKKYNKKVVIIIDEYDKPVIDNITDRDASRINRDALKNFYSAIKDSDQLIRFVFITGVSKFSKMNLFSGLNNLEDITLNSDYATITGYTHDDLKKTFSDYFDGVDLEKVRKWYSGYNYFGEPVYNPFDILLFLSNKCEFSNYWWETGNPAFLIELLKNGNYYIPELENTTVDKETLNCFDVEKIDLVALLWQTGYLTFEKKYEFAGSMQYRMKIPNLEIQGSLNRLFINYLTDMNGEKTRRQNELYKNIIDKDFHKLRDSLHSLFASIPYTNYVNNVIANYEGYYASVVFTFLASLGFDTIAEDTTSRGRVDITLKTPDTIIILEFKVDSLENAIKQIKTNRYYEKYQGCGKEIHLIGINFDSTLRNITEYVWEKM